MADQANAVVRGRFGDPDVVFPAVLGPFGVAANTLIYGGAMVATDGNGNINNCDFVGAGVTNPVQIVGVARKTYYNRTTDPSGGAAAAVNNAEVLQGAFPFFISTDGGAITNASRWQTVYAVDNQTVSLAANTALGQARLPAGYLVQVDNLGGAYNGMAWVQMGELNPYAGINRLSVVLSTAAIQAQTSGTAFTIMTLPPNAYLLGAEVVNLVAFGTITTLTASLAGGSDAAGSILAAGTVFALGATNAAPGSNPYQKRGAQAIKLTLTGSGALSTATLGSLQVDLFVAVFS